VPSFHKPVPHKCNDKALTASFFSCWNSSISMEIKNLYEDSVFAIYKVRIVIFTVVDLIHSRDDNVFGTAAFV